MKRPESLSGGRDFRDVNKRGTRRSSDGLTARVLARPSRPTRLGLVVGRRCGKAVTRNRIRRRLREAFKAAGPAEGYDVVLSADADVATMPFPELVGHLEAILPERGALS